MHVLRLSPGEDLTKSLYQYARVKGFSSASIVSIVGSLNMLSLRFANQPEGTVLKGYYEIVSATGNIDLQTDECTQSDKGGCGHVHLAASNDQGSTVGGHALTGNIVFTTAEITLLEATEGTFYRAFDDLETGGSGYEELRVIHNYNEHIED